MANLYGCSRSPLFSAFVSMAGNRDHLWGPLQCEPSTHLWQRHPGQERLPKRRRVWYGTGGVGGHC